MPDSLPPNLVTLYNEDPLLEVQVDVIDRSIVHGVLRLLLLQSPSFFEAKDEPDLQLNVVALWLHLVDLTELRDDRFEGLELEVRIVLISKDLCGYVVGDTLDRQLYESLLIHNVKHGPMNHLGLQLGLLIRVKGSNPVNQEFGAVHEPILVAFDNHKLIS